MELPASTVVVCEENKTRADLYDLWLDRYETRQALTKKQSAEAFDGSVAVLVIEHTFGDNAVDAILDRCESKAPQCRALGIRKRSNALPESGYDHELTRPVFEDDLTDCVTRLLCQANYQILLELYYRTTVTMSSYEWKTKDGEIKDERYQRLKDRAGRLQHALGEIRTRMSNEDVRAVVHDITVDEIAGIESTETFENKYRPDRCSRCSQDWSKPIDGDAPATQLGAYVWRCVNCGHVQMHTDPSHQHVGSYRK